MDKWKQLEEGLSGLCATVSARADGHDLVFKKVFDRERLVIELYVDGWVKGEWSKADEHGQPVAPQGRFWRPYRTRAWKLSQYKELKKAFGKKRADEMTALRTVAYLHVWNSPITLVRHLKKHFSELEVIDLMESAEA